MPEPRDVSLRSDKRKPLQDPLGRRATRIIGYTQHPNAGTRVIVTSYDEVVNDIVNIDRLGL